MSEGEGGLTNSNPPPSRLVAGEIYMSVDNLIAIVLFIAIFAVLVAPSPSK